MALYRNCRLCFSLHDLNSPAGGTEHEQTGAAAVTAQNQAGPETGRGAPETPVTRATSCSRQAAIRQQGEPVEPPPEPWCSGSGEPIKCLVPGVGLAEGAENHRGAAPSPDVV